MKTLFVLRHAKSSWGNENQTDFERPLNERGLKAAPKIGKLMCDKDFVPDLIVSSPAVRAKRTAELVKDAAGFDAELRFEPRIYEATTTDLFAVLSEISDNYERVMLVGHNPGSENLVRELTGETRAMPTAALAVILLEIKDWSDLRPDCGRLQDLFKPNFNNYEL